MSRGELPTVCGELYSGWSIDVMKVIDPDDQVMSNDDPTEKIVTKRSKKAEAPLTSSEHLKKKRKLGNHFRAMHE